MFQNKIKTQGFTLIEILIALFIFTIVAMIMSHALHTIFISQAGTQNELKDWRIYRKCSMMIPLVLFFAGEAGMV